MPELPEVETVVRSLKPILKNQRILSFNRYWKVLDNITLPKFRNSIKDTIILEVKRRAKFLVIKTDSGYVLFHLRMTGKLYPSNSLPVEKKHISAIFTLENNIFLIFLQNFI